MRTGAAVTVTGLPALSGSSVGEGTGVLAEVLIAALAVLAFVFAWLLALVPLLVAAIAILTTFLLILGLTYLTSISFYVQFLIALVGLGVAIDYSLLVTRWTVAIGLAGPGRPVRAVPAQHRHRRDPHPPASLVGKAGGRWVCGEGNGVAFCWQMVPGGGRAPVCR